MGGGGEEWDPGNCLARHTFARVFVPDCQNTNEMAGKGEPYVPSVKDFVSEAGPAWASSSIVGRSEEANWVNG